MTPSPRGRRWSVAAAPRRPHPPSPDAPGTESRSPALSPGREAWRDWPKGRRRRTMTGVRQVGRGAAPSDRGGTCREPRWPQRPAQNSPPHSGGSAQVGAAVHLRMRRRPAPRWPAEETARWRSQFQHGLRSCRALGATAPGILPADTQLVFRGPHAFPV